MMRRNTAKKLTAFLAVMVMLLGALAPAGASAKLKMSEANLKDKVTALKNTEKSVLWGQQLYGSMLGILRADSCTDLFGTTDAGCTGTGWTLYVTENGKKLQKISLDGMIREAAGVYDTDAIAVYHMNTIGDVLYITGGAGGGTEDVPVPFIVRVKGKKAKVILPQIEVVEYPYMQSFGLYQVNGKFVAIADTLTEADGGKARYFISDDLENWKEKNLEQTYTSEDKDAVWHVLDAGKNGLILNEQKWGLVTGGLIPENKVIRTTNFKTWKEVKKINKLIKTKDNGAGKDGKWTDIYVDSNENGKLVVFAWTRKGRPGSDSETVSARILTGNSLSDLTEAVSLSKKFSEANWFITDSRLYAFADESGKDSTFYGGALAAAAAGSASGIAASQITDNEYDAKGYVYLVIDGKKIAAINKKQTKASIVTVGKKNIGAAAVIGSYLVISVDGGKDFRIPLSALRNTVK